MSGLSENAVQELTLGPDGQYQVDIAEIMDGPNLFVFRQAFPFSLFKIQWSCV